MRSCKKSIVSVLIVILIFSIFPAFCQDGYVVSTNRPNQTDAIGVMAPGYIQMETGIGYQGDSNDLFESDMIFFPSLQLRYGIVPKLEINIFYDYNDIQATNSGQEVNFNNQFFTLGSKYHLWDENGPIPEVAGIFNLHYSNLFDGATDDWDWEIRFIFQNSITDRFALAYMLRYRNDFAFTLNPSYTINEKWSAFFEYFSDIRIDSPLENQNGINLGLGYLVSNRVTLDLMYGTIFTEGVSTNLLTTGLGWWIK